MKPPNISSLPYPFLVCSVTLLSVVLAHLIIYLLIPLPGILVSYGACQSIIPLLIMLFLFRP